MEEAGAGRPGGPRVQHAPGHPDAEGPHGGLDVLHRVVDAQRLRLVPEPRALFPSDDAGRVDVEVDGLGGVVVLEVEHLRDEELGHRGDEGHALLCFFSRLDFFFRCEFGFAGEMGKNGVEEEEEGRVEKEKKGRRRGHGRRGRAC